MKKLLTIDYNKMKSAAEYMARYAAVGEVARRKKNLGLELTMQDYIEGALVDIQRSFIKK